MGYTSCLNGPIDGSLYLHLFIVCQDKDVRLEFFRSKEEDVTTTVKIERLTPEDATFALDVFVENGDTTNTFTCPDRDGHTNITEDGTILASIMEDGTILGHVQIPNDTNCSKFVVVVSPPPRVRIKLTLFVNNGAEQMPHGPFFIGQEGKCD